MVILVLWTFTRRPSLSEGDSRRQPHNCYDSQHFMHKSPSSGCYVEKFHNLFTSDARPVAVSDSQGFRRQPVQSGCQRPRTGGERILTYEVRYRWSERQMLRKGP